MTRTFINVIIIMIIHLFLLQFHVNLTAREKILGLIALFCKEWRKKKNLQTLEFVFVFHWVLLYIKTQKTPSLISFNRTKGLTWVIEGSAKVILFNSKCSLLIKWLELWKVKERLEGRNKQSKIRVGKKEKRFIHRPQRGTAPVCSCRLLLADSR